MQALLRDCQCKNCNIPDVDLHRFPLTYICAQLLSELATPKDSFDRSQQSRQMD